VITWNRENSLKSLIRPLSRARSLSLSLSLAAMQGDPACKALEPVMHVVYNKRPVPGVFEDFSNVRARVNREWASVVCVRVCPIGMSSLSVSSLPPPLSCWPLILACSLSLPFRNSATKRLGGGVHTYTTHTHTHTHTYTTVDAWNTRAHVYTHTHVLMHTHVHTNTHSSLLPFLSPSSLPAPPPPPLSFPLLSRRAATRYHHHCKPKSMTSCGLAAGLSTNVRFRKRVVQNGEGTVRRAERGGWRLGWPMRRRSAP
jgi:hypothetical protein